MEYDVLIIGAGINGAGIARDAAMRGLKVLLIDKQDLASGTSAYSTRLVHGGLRYLEYGEVHLVRESLREREVLLRHAGHLVKPLGLMIPIYRHHKRGRLMIWAGMVAYDLLSFDKSLDHHHMYSRQETLKRLPGLNPGGLVGAAMYYDCQVEYAERLVVENALSALEHGTELRTYCQVESILPAASGLLEVELRDVVTGQVTRERARSVINVAGPWVDRVLQRTGQDLPRQMGGTKGSHLVVRAFPGAPEQGLYVEASADGRPFFILPWNDLFLIGTTDLRSDEELDTLEASHEEREYLLREANLVFPQAGLTQESILYTYSGVRPLPYTPAGSTAAITRRHLVVKHQELPGLFSVVGGKLTTYRNLAELAVDTLAEHLRQPLPRCQTARLPLPGSTHMDREPYRSQFQARHNLSALSAGHLLRTYGQRAELVMELARSQAGLEAVICPDTGALAAEVKLAVEQEQARTLSDVMLRRTMIGLGPNLGLGQADAAAVEIAADCLGWSAARRKQELEDYRRLSRRFAQPQLRG